MESEFPQVRLGDICKLRSGYPFKSADWTESGEPVIKIANVKSGRILPEGCAFVSSSIARQAGEWYTQPGDILIAMTGYVGELAWVRPGERYLINQRVGRFEKINASKVIPRYLFYALQHPEIRGLIETIARGSAQPNLSAGDSHGIEIPLPSLQSQKQIEETLSALDDKIALLRETNATLESIAQALFKSWFVDFDPVRAKAEGRDPEGVPPEVADLFPSEFEDSELGAIPKGWMPATLKELTTKIGSGATPRGGKDVYVADGIALVRSQNVYDSEFTWEGLARITPDQAEGLSNVELQPGDVLLNITGASILRTCVVDPSVLPARVNQHVAIIRAKAGVPSRFLHQHLLRPSTKDYLMGMNAGASREAVTKAHIESVPILLPPQSILAQFQMVTDSGFSRVENNAAEIRSLTGIRDTLLPRLMSGKLRISGGTACQTP